MTSANAIAGGVTETVSRDGTVSARLEDPPGRADARADPVVDSSIQEAGHREIPAEINGVTNGVRGRIGHRDEGLETSRFPPLPRCRK